MAGQYMAEDEHTIQITLPLPEALVLFEWAYRFTETRRLQFSHAAEAIVIDLVASELEWKLPTVFTDEYPALLAGARNSVAGAYRDRMGNHSQWLEEVAHEADEPAA